MKPKSFHNRLCFPSLDRSYIFFLKWQNWNIVSTPLYFMWPGSAKNRSDAFSFFPSLTLWHSIPRRCPSHDCLCHTFCDCAPYARGTVFFCVRAGVKPWWSNAQRSAPAGRWDVKDNGWPPSCCCFCFSLRRRNKRSSRENVQIIFLFISFPFRFFC